MNAFSRLQPNPPPLAVTVEPLQDDFNYAAFTSRGAEVWPQSYLGDMTPRDPQAVIDRVATNGVPRARIVPVLGPDQLDDGYNGPHNLYTADDIQGRTPSAQTTPTPADPSSPAAGGFRPAVTQEQIANDRAARDAVRAATPPAATTTPGAGSSPAVARPPAVAPPPDPAPSAAAAPLVADPDDLQGNLDDEDAGADEVDGSNEDESEEGGSGEDANDSDSDDDDSDADDESDDESDDDEDAPGEGSNGEDADDSSSDGADSGDGDSDDDDSDDSSGESSGSESVTAALQAIDADYPGEDAPREQVAAWMASAAQKRGLPPELPVMAALTESGLRNLGYGDADSVGFFQMRVSIWNQGAYSGYTDKPERQLQWFLDHAEAVKKQRLARGLSVDDQNQFGQWIADVERPATQYRGRYQLRLEEARKLLGKT